MQDILDGLFDRLYVISLPRSHDRRSYIRRHFEESGITRYRFFDATGPDSPAVADAFDAGRVRRFPSCFRCGGLECGRPDCNNDLLPAQVANFLTQKALWREIAANPQRALVMEDDVILSPHAGRIFAALRDEVEAGRLEFHAEAPRLLRLGWGWCADHEDGPFRMVESVRMSNPCHAMTSAFADRLLQRWRRFDTTSDVFIHERAPEPGEAYTVLPPVAHEMSWSTGETESLIHPKQKYADYLARIGESERARDYERRLRLHPIRKFHRPALILETPNLNPPGLIEEAAGAGREIGRDIDGRDGLASWRFAVDATAPWLDPPVLRSRAFVHHAYVIHAVNAPLTAAGAILEAIRQDAEIRRTARAVTGRSVHGEHEEADWAVEILAAWSERIASLRPALTFRVEDQGELLVRFLSARPEFPAAASTFGEPPAGGRPGASLQLRPRAGIDRADLSENARRILADYAGRYGYSFEESPA